MLLPHIAAMKYTDVGAPFVRDVEAPFTRDVEVSNPEGVSATNGSSPLAVVESAVPYHDYLRSETLKGFPFYPFYLSLF